MSDEINVVSRTQIIVVDPVSSSVAVINAGPSGPPGPAGSAGPAGPVGPEGTPLYRIAPSDVSRASDTAATADPVLLFTPVANAVYHIDAVVYYEADAGAGFKVGWGGPTGATFAFTEQIAGSTAQELKAISALSSVAGAGIGTVRAYMAQGIATIGATIDNDFRIRWAQQTSFATASVRKAGSYMLAKRLA